jgi:hypothetical protein
MHYCNKNDLKDILENHTTILVKSAQQLSTIISEISSETPNIAAVEH